MGNRRDPRITKKIVCRGLVAGSPAYAARIRLEQLVNRRQLTGKLLGDFFGPQRGFVSARSCEHEPRRICSRRVCSARSSCVAGRNDRPHPKTAPPDQSGRNSAERSEVTTWDQPFAREGSGSITTAASASFRCRNFAAPAVAAPPPSHGSTVSSQYSPCRPPVRARTVIVAEARHVAQVVEQS